MDPDSATLRESNMDDRANGEIRRWQWCAALGSQAIELLLPSTCRLCKACVPPGRDFCTSCQSQLQSSINLMQFACIRCGRSGSGKPRMMPSCSQSAEKCPHCQQETFHFDACIGLWAYDGLVRQAVVAAKYGSQIALADALGRRLSQAIQDVFADSERASEAGRIEQDAESNAHPIDRPDLITPVPSHLWRRLQRGGGGSRVLAATVARSLRKSWPTTKLTNLLETTRPIKKQAWLGEKERAKNVSGAFRLSRTLWSRTLRSKGSASRLNGLHVMVIDDVMTTGATASEIAALLKLAGARKVTIGVVARAHSG